jgi:hypothetical protein
MEEDACMSCEEEDTYLLDIHGKNVSNEEEDICMSYEEQDTCMSYEEEDTHL